MWQGRVVWLGISTLALFVIAKPVGAECRKVCMPDETRDAQGCCASANSGAQSAKTPTLTETLGWMRDKMLATGVVVAATVAPPDQGGLRTEFQVTPLSFENCTIEYHLHVEYKSPPNNPTDQDIQLPLADIAPRSLMVDPVIMKTSIPPGVKDVSVLFLATARGKKSIRIRPHGQTGEGEYVNDVPRFFVSYDQDLVERMKKALTHAIGLCAAQTKPEPF
jgi:hypothetical protein